MPFPGTLIRTVDGMIRAASRASSSICRWVVLATWLASTPSVLILNDPTRGVDVGAKREVHHAIRELAATGLTVLMWSSDAAETLELCERILVMSKGSITATYDARSTTLPELLLAMQGET